MTQTEELESEAGGGLIYIAALKPAPLFTIQTEVGGKQVKALVDTGATHNFIKGRLTEEIRLQVNQGEAITIRGLGTTEFMTRGDIEAEVSIAGLTIGVGKFLVAPDNIINNHIDIVLGLTFLKKFQFVIDVSKRQLSKHNEDNSTWHIWADEEGQVTRIVKERVPVCAAGNAVLNRGIIRVPVQVDNQVSNKKDIWFFEGVAKGKNFRGLDGIIEPCGTQENFILMAREDENNKRDSNLKKGDKVGELTTMMEMDYLEEERQYLTWEQIRQAVEMGTTLGADERVEIWEMLKDMQTVFSKGDIEVGNAKVSPHGIELTSYCPIWQKPRRFADPINREIEKQCEDLLKLDVIEHSQSGWSSPVVPVRKSNGELRLCVDYRKLNSVTRTEKFPMPNLCDSVYSAQGAKYFSKLDLVKGYYQIPLEEESREFTAFSTIHNHYQFKTLSFGLKNSGICFQRTMQSILSEFCFKNVIVYIDDILIMTRTFREHVELTRRVLNTLRVNGFIVNIGKCEFAKEEVEFLGHRVSREGIRKSLKFISQIEEYPKPTTVTEMRQFLGLVNFQGKFVKNLSTLAQPLNASTSGAKKKKLIWTSEMEGSFNSLKEELVRDIALTYPDYGEQAEPLELSVDASCIGAGACLQQNQSGIYKTIAYSSITFSKAQRQYSTIERELAAIRWGLKTFRSFLFGVKFVLFTDHKPLLYLQNMRNESSKFMRTITELSEYDFLIRYRPGMENGAADAMSRIVTITEAAGEDHETDLFPKGLELLKEVKGGGDSFFESIYSLLKEYRADRKYDLPENLLELRRVLTDHILNNTKVFKIKLNKESKKRLEQMKRQGQLPCELIIQVVCHVFDVQIWVHHGMNYPVVYSRERTNVNTNKIPVLHLQCISGIHFNPLVCKEGEEKMICLTVEKNFNACINEEQIGNINNASVVSERGTEQMDVCDSCKGVSDNIQIKVAG